MPRTKESGIDGIETDPNEIAPMALFGLVIKEQEVETLAKAYLDMREALERIAVRRVLTTDQARLMRNEARAALGRPE